MFVVNIYLIINVTNHAFINKEKHKTLFGMVFFLNLIFLSDVKYLHNLICVCNVSMMLIRLCKTSVKTNINIVVSFSYVPTITSDSCTQKLPFYK